MADPSIDAQLLQWHAGALTVGMEAFRLWALVGLAAQLRFDGAIWGASASAADAHFHRTSDAVLQGPEGALLLRRLAALPAGRAVVLDASTKDGASPPTPHQPQQIEQAIALRWAEPGGAQDQFVLLRRGRADDPFDDAERERFERLAPHLMLAFSTSRRLQLAGAFGRGGQVPVRASALVDRTGRIHEHDPRFVRTLRREWPEWNGARLPDALVSHKARKLTSRWQFLGREIVADFLPVNSLTLVSARFRLPADSLTAREWEIARRYAAGNDFRQVAEILAVAPATVRSHLRRVFSKLGVRNKAQLLARLD